VARCSNWPVYEVYGGNFLCSLKEQKLDELVQEVVQAGEGCLQIQHPRKHHLAIQPLNLRCTKGEMDSVVRC
jgi:hypothetical protein